MIWPTSRANCRLFTRTNIDTETLQSIIDNKTKPPGSLGRIESLALQLGEFLNTDKPHLQSCELTIFAADHGIVAAGVSGYPQEVTRQMVLNFLAGGAAANVFAGATNVSLQVVDAGVAGDPIDHPKLLRHRMGNGTADSSVEAAMSEQQCDEALRIGHSIGERSQADVLCFGEMGIGNTSSATLVLHKTLDIPVAKLVGRGTGLDDDGLAHKQAILEQASARAGTDLTAQEILVEVGGFEIAMMTGAMLGAVASNKPVIVDGFIATAAAALTLLIEAHARPALIFAHRSSERGHEAALRALDAQPLLDLDMRLGEGTGALLAWPLVKTAAAMLRDMASFDDAGVSGPA